MNRVGLRPILADDVKPPVAINVGDDGVVRAGSANDVLGPIATRAVGFLENRHAVLVRLMHLSGQEIQVAVPVEIPQIEL